MSSNDNTSTLKSYVDSTTGAVQSALGSVTGSTGDKAEGGVKKDKAAAEYDASQATAKLPGFTASSSGAVTKDDPDRAAGSYNQTVGAAKEALGGIIGSEGLKQAGQKQNAEGKEQEAKGQISDYVSGVSDRVTGTVGSAVTGLTGNASAKQSYDDQHDAGKTTQRGAEHDILKNAEAEEAAQKKD